MARTPDSASQCGASRQRVLVSTTSSGAAENADSTIFLALSRARGLLDEVAVSAEQRRLLAPALAEIDRSLTALRPERLAFEPPAANAPALSPSRELEALRREIERMRAVRRDDRGLLDTILNTSPHGIFVSDPHGKLILQNRAAERIWAGSATTEGMEGWGEYRAFHPDGRPFEPGDWSMARCLLRREVITTEQVHFQRFDGTHGMLLGSCAPILSPEGELLGAVAVFADITEFKELEVKLRLSEARLATTLRGIDDAVITADLHDRIDFMNVTAERLTGWTLAEARGLRLKQVVQIIAESTPSSRDSGRARPSTGVTQGARLVCKDGTALAVDHSSAPIRNADEQTLGVAVVFRDVTGPRRAEQRRQFLSEASRQFALSGLDYDSTLASVVSLAVPRLADGAIADIIESNGTVTRLAAVQTDPARADLAAELRRSYPSDPEVPHVVHTVLREGRSILWQNLDEPPMGTDATGNELAPLDPESGAFVDWLRAIGACSAMIVPLRARGRTRGAITLVSFPASRRYDIEDLILAEELSSFAALALDNAQLYRESQQVNRAKDDFLATLSHELRTPLTAIIGWTRIIRHEAIKPETMTRALETIERNAALQARLVEDLLDASRIITGKLRLELSIFDLVPLVHAAVEAVRPSAAGVEIQIDLGSSACLISGDPTRIQQVVWNILSNAVKFTPRGGRIQVRLSRSDSTARIAVIDTGRGIPADFLPHVFERFRQGDSTSTRSQGGLGLGLAIARHLIELHGGALRAESAGEGKGATFIIALPVAVGAEPPIRSDRTEALGADLTLQGIQVLVADDDDDARELITEILARKGATVTAVSTVREAFTSIERQKPDVILSDLGMPGEDGYTLIRRLRAGSPERGGRIPAAAITAYATAEDRARALRAGFQSHVSKPIDAADIVAAVANLAGRTG